MPKLKVIENYKGIIAPTSGVFGTCEDEDGLPESGDDFDKNYYCTCVDQEYNEFIINFSWYCLNQFKYIIVAKYGKDAKDYTPRFWFRFDLRTFDYIDETRIAVEYYHSKQKLPEYKNLSVDFFYRNIYGDSYADLRLMEEALA